MGKVLTVIGGTVAVVLGVVLLLSWWGWFLRGLMAVLPCMLILGGVVALMAGVSEIKDVLKEKKKDDKK